MPDIEYLRRAMRAETSDLPMHLTVDAIRRRARGLRARRTAAVAGACVLITAVAVPAYALHSGQTGQRPAHPLPTSDSSECQAVPPDPFSYREAWIDTGASIKGADGQQYEVLFTGFSQLKSDATLAVVFVNQKTNRRSIMGLTEAGRHADGEFIVDGSAGTQRYRLLSNQLALGPDRVLDFGIYSRAADRITVASEGRRSPAQVRVSEDGWTMFWVVRNAKPLPKDADTGPREYTGPERLTITAYDNQGRVLDTVTGGFRIGRYTQNPRDNWSGSPLGASPTGSDPDAFGPCDVLNSATASPGPASTP